MNNSKPQEQARYLYSSKTQNGLLLLSCAMGTMRTLKPTHHQGFFINIKPFFVFLSILFKSKSEKTRNPCCSAKMVKELIMFTARLDGLTLLQPRGGCDDLNLPYYFKLKCFNCGYVTEKDSCVFLSVTVPDGKGFPNLVQQCKGCTRVGTVTLVRGYGSPLMLDKSKAGEYAPLMLLDYQGLEPVDFSVGKGWKAESVLGTQFEIDLAEGEFTAYCDKGKVPVSLSGFEVKLG